MQIVFVFLHKQIKSMKKLLVVVFAMVLSSTVFAQKTLQRPKVVIGIAVDQMRWDYIYKFYNLYSDNGFKRLLNNGYVCQNTMVNYLPSHTAPGHTAIYTGSVPSITGIAGNAFIENTDGKLHDACEDKTVNTIGGEKKGSSSPKNMLVTTIGDELRIATNMKSRTFSVAIKNRGSIFPGGHLCNGAYWFDDDLGKFTTSTYYMEKLPDWLVKFNSNPYKKQVMDKGWYLSFKDYSLSTDDNSPYESKFPKENSPTFPHLFTNQSEEERNETFEMTPYGNQYTIMMAQAMIEGEHIGKSAYTDFLSISFSSPDELAHKFGCNSVEIQDMMLLLDKQLSEFFTYLDATYIPGNYLLFLTADHGGSHNAEYLKDIKVPAGVFEKQSVANVNLYLKNKFGVDSLVIGFTNYYQFFLNNPLLAKSPISRADVRQAIIDWALEKPEVLYAIDLYNISSANVPTRIIEMVKNGYNRRRGGDVQLILNPANYEYAGKNKGNTHGTWSPADTHIPLIFYGWGVKKGESTVEVYTTDIAPTVSALLHIQMPNGCIGKPIQLK